MLGVSHSTMSNLHPLSTLKHPHTFSSCHEKYFQFCKPCTSLSWPERRRHVPSPNPPTHKNSLPGALLPGAHERCLHGDKLRLPSCPLRKAGVKLWRRRALLTKAFAAQGGAADVASEAAPALRTLYPSLKSHLQGKLQVSDRHTIHYEVFGNPKGQPALFLHGGPGAGCTNNHARFFDPAHYRIILFDQRGCGASRPRGCLIENTTWDLVDDIEKLRTHLNVNKWIVVGGSWGVTLALAYAQAHPQRVAGLILRGICLLRRQEIGWFYTQGASSLFPFGWEALNQAIPAEERSDLVAAFYRRLTAADPQVQEQAASAWLRWEMSLSSFSVSPFVYAWDGRQYSSIPLPSASTETPQAGPSRTATGPQPQQGPPAASSNPSPPTATTGASQPSIPPSSETSSTHNGAPTHSQSTTSTSPTSTPSSDLPSQVRAADISNADVASPSANTTSPDGGTVLSRGSDAAGATAASSGDGATSSSSSSTGDGALEGSDETRRSGVATGGPVRGPRGVGPALDGREKMSGFVVQARIECHYFYHWGFLREAQLLEDISRVCHIPAIMVQGRYDFVCPVVNAFDLHRAWPEAELRIVPNAGHSMYEPGIAHELVLATDRFKQLEY